jgi:uncharacterized membrane protein YhhN
MGDIFLLFDHLNPVFFLFGLGSFLITHLLYIFYFIKVNSGKSEKGKKYSWLHTLVLAYGVILLYLLWPALGNMKIPVVIYAICICSMVIFCFRIQNSIPEEVWKWLAIGAVLFVISDSILALNKFSNPIPLGPVMIMLTYGLAQFFITWGAVKLSQAACDAPAKLEG